MIAFREPGLRLMRLFRTPQKMALMASVLLVPLLLLSVGLLYQGLQDIQAARRAQSSLSVIGQLSEVMQSLQRGRALTLQAQSGAAQLGAERDTTRQSLKGALEQLDVLLAQQDATRVQQLLKPYNGRFQETVSGALPESPEATAALYGDLIEGTGHMLQASSEDSGLLFDAESVTHFLVDLLVEHLPVWSEAMAQTRLSAADVAREQRAQAEHNAILKLNIMRGFASLHEVQDRIHAVERAGSEAPATWDSTRKASEAFLTLSQRLLTTGDASLTPASIMSAGDDALGALSRMQKNTLAELHQRFDQRLHALWRGLLAKLGVCLASLLLVAYLSSCFYDDFFHNLAQVHESVAAVTRGNLSVRTTMNGRDEFVQLGHSIDAMSERLSTLVADVRSSAVRVGQSGLSVSEDGQALSRHTEEQAANLRQSVSTVEALSAAVSSNAEAAVALDQMTMNLRHQAEAGAAAMDETVNSIHSLQESARRIGEINNVINDIAFETNLLALNAAVEAARAGESGKGFAVVAAEVRQLAQRCAEAASEVHDVIESTTDLVEVSVERVSGVSQTLNSVVRGVNDVSSRLRSIASASEEQSLGLQAVTASVGGLDDLTHLNASLVDRSGHSSRTLVTQAEALRRSVAHIQLRQGSADEAHALVQKALAHVAERGWARAAQDFNDAHGAFVDRDLHLFALHRDGTFLVMGQHPEWVGRHIDDIPDIPPDMAHDLLNHVHEVMARGQGWVEYATPISPDNPSGQRKVAFMAAIDEDTCLGCGAYVTHSATPAANPVRSKVA